jgi:hypothetical protein
MKRILSLFLVVMFVLSIATMGFADVIYTRGPDSRVLTYTLAQTAVTTLSSTVTTYNRILGFTFTDSAGGTGSLFDGATVATVQASDTTYLIGEIKVAAGGTTTVMFPLPRDVKYGLVTRQSTATGCLIVYYE